MAYIIHGNRRYPWIIVAPPHVPHIPASLLSRVQGVVVFNITIILCVGIDVILVFVIVVIFFVTVNVNRVFWSGSSRLLCRIRLLGRVSLIGALIHIGRQSKFVTYRHYGSLSLVISHPL